LEEVAILMAGVTAVILFIFGLQNFSAEIQHISGDQFRRALARATRMPAVGLLIGALVTAVIQSSSATSVIAISLVNAGVLSFKNSIGIIFGSNIGTTVTAQLVAFKLTEFAPLLIILGFAVSLLRSRIAIFGKSIFYFGFVFFSLNLISTAMAPLQGEPGLIAFLVQPQNPFLALAAGCLFTALVQSSSVTTGLAIIFTQQGLMGLENAVPIIIGANLGTTVTALIAMFGMDTAAKKTALSHVLFNLGGVVLFFPIYLIWGDRLQQFDTDPALLLANVHLVFNVSTSLVFMALFSPFTRAVDLILGEGKMDFERQDIPQLEDAESFDLLRERLHRNLRALLSFLQENYNEVTLSIESNYRSVFEASEKRIEYVNFLEREYMAFFSRAVVKVTDDSDSRELLELVTLYDYLFQIHDSIDDLFKSRRIMSKHYIELKSDVLLLVRELSSHTLVLFDEINRALREGSELDVSAEAKNLHKVLDNASRELLVLVADPNRRDAGALSHFVTYSRRLKDKLLNFAALAIRVQRAAQAPEQALGQAELSGS
jgi:phosphate:Na+ symporter